MARGADAGLALVTGASGGIGEQLAHVFARHGHPVVLTARSADRLRTVAQEISRRHGVEAWPIALDLGRRDAGSDLAAQLADRNLRVRHLVNNAGFGLAGAFADHALQDELDLLDLNIRAVTELTHRFLPEIRAARGGILNVASAAAFQPGPFMATYYASKTFVLSFSEALALELRRDGVQVTALCPGPVPTAFQKRAGMAASGLSHLMPTLSAADVAEHGYRAYRRGRTVCVPGAANMVAVGVSSVAPRAVAARLAAFFNRGRS